MGGTSAGPYHRLCCDRVGNRMNAASCLIATNVSHVYSNDPSIDSGAVKIMKMSHEELRTIVGDSSEHKAGGRL